MPSSAATIMVHTELFRFTFCILMSLFFADIPEDRPIAATALRVQRRSSFSMPDVRDRLSKPLGGSHTGTNLRNAGSGRAARSRVEDVYPHHTCGRRIRDAWDRSRNRYSERIVRISTCTSPYPAH